MITPSYVYLWNDDLHYKQYSDVELDNWRKGTEVVVELHVLGKLTSVC